MPIQRDTEVLRELYRILETRDGAVYRTEYVEDVWISLGALPPRGYQYVVKSSSYTGQVIRTVYKDSD